MGGFGRQLLLLIVLVFCNFSVVAQSIGGGQEQKTEKQEIKGFSVAENLKETIVIIKAPPYGASEIIGTGFFISERGHILTAAHNLNNKFSVKIQTYGNFKNTSINNIWNIADVLDVNKYLDVALLKVREDISSKPLIPGDSTEIEENDLKVPYNTSLLGHAKEFGGSRTFFRGYQLDVKIVFEGGPIGLGDYVSSGMSGGPVLNGEKKLVGIIQQLNPVGEETHFLPLHYCKNFLLSNGISYVPGSLSDYKEEIVLLNEKVESYLPIMDSIRTDLNWFGYLEDDVKYVRPLEGREFRYSTTRNLVVGFSKKFESQAEPEYGVNITVFPLFKGHHHFATKEASTSEENNIIKFSKARRNYPYKIEDIEDSINGEIQASEKLPVTYKLENVEALVVKVSPLGEKEFSKIKQKWLLIDFSSGISHFTMFPPNQNE
ncbi:MAG: hypothetical protein NPIRA06_03550 [Nitrospirales bacterium]|nr:MAG: hypothetical protein NPIRA06_03550 [Nitrospirales bacterium]